MTRLLRGNSEPCGTVRNTAVTGEVPLHVLSKVEQILHLVPFVTKQARDPSPRTAKLSRPELRGLQQVGSHKDPSHHW